MAKKKPQQCKHCRHWTTGWASDQGFNHCYHPRIQSGSSCEKGRPAPLVAYGGYEGYGDYINTAPEFGCVLWEEKAGL